MSVRIPTPLTSPIRNLVFGLLTYAVAPLLAVGLIELGLRAGGVGRDTRLLTAHPDHPGLLLANPDVAYRYFAESENPPRFGSNDAIAAVKADSTYRIFALGGSTTAGFPYFFNGSFPAIIKQQLESINSGYTIEMMNLGMTAVTSLTVLDFTSDLMAYDPDLIIVYTGHNEFYGALGTATSGRRAGSLRLDRLYVRLSRLRLFQVLKLAVRALTSHTEVRGSATMTRMARVVGVDSIALGDPLYSKTLERLESNLQLIAREATRHNVPVIFGTLVSNLAHHPPFVSVSNAANDGSKKLLQASVAAFEAGEFDTALALARSTVHSDSTDAAGWYQLGTVLLKIDATDSAAAALSRARDLDGLRFRASSDVNRIIRSVAREENVLLADCESMLSGHSPGGIIGAALMLEHLHPNYAGNELLATCFTETILAHRLIHSQPVGTTIQPNPSGIPLTPLDETAAIIQIKVLKSGWPFAENGRALTLQNYPAQDWLDALAIQLLKGNLNYWEAHEQAATQYTGSGDLLAAVLEWAALAQAFPYEWRSHQRLAHALISAGNLDAAVKPLRRTLRLRNDAYAAKWLGSILLQNKQYIPARRWLRQAVILKPDDMQARYNLSGVYYYMGELEKAISELDTVLMTEPNHPGARDFLEELQSVTVDGNNS